MRRSIRLSPAAAIAANVLLSLPTLSRYLQVWRVVRRPSEFMVRVVLRAILSAIASIAVAINIRVFDPLFVRSGRLCLLRPPPLT